MEKKRLEICDITLREGEQSPGVFFDLPDKIKLGEEFLKAGINNIEIGIVGIDSDEKAYKKIFQNSTQFDRNLSMTLLPYDTLYKSYLKQDIQNINIIVPMTEILSGAFGLNLKSIHHKIVSWIKNLDKRKKQFRIVLADTSRAIFFNRQEKSLYTQRISVEHLGVLTDVIDLFAKEGVKEFIIADTQGIFIPNDVQFIMDFLNAKYNDIRWGVHFHNDFGLATANVLTAFQHGASLLQTAFNGLGERSGIASTAEICASLKYLFNVDLGIDIGRLRKIATKLESITGVILNERTPILGKGLYWYETATPLFSIMKYGPHFSEIIPAGDVGEQRKLIIGKHTSARLFDYLKERKIVETKSDFKTIKIQAINRRRVYISALRTLIETYHKMSEESVTSVPILLIKDNK